MTRPWRHITYPVARRLSTVTLTWCRNPFTGVWRLSSCSWWSRPQQVPETFTVSFPRHAWWLTNFDQCHQWRGFVVAVGKVWVSLEKWSPAKLLNFWSSTISLPREFHMHHKESYWIHYAIAWVHKSTPLQLCDTTFRQQLQLYVNVLDSTRFDLLVGYALNTLHLVKLLYSDPAILWSDRRMINKSSSWWTH